MYTRLDTFVVGQLLYFVKVMSSFKGTQGKGRYREIPLVIRL